MITRYLYSFFLPALIIFFDCSACFVPEAQISAVVKRTKELIQACSGYNPNFSPFLDLEPSQQIYQVFDKLTPFVLSDEALKKPIQDRLEQLTTRYKPQEHQFALPFIMICYRKWDTKTQEQSQKLTQLINQYQDQKDQNVCHIPILQTIITETKPALLCSLVTVNDTNCVKAFLSLKLDTINRQNREKKTPLMLACQTDQKQQEDCILTVLLNDLTIDVNIMDRNNETALFDMIDANESYIPGLLAKQPDLSPQKDQAHTVLNHFIVNQRYLCAQKLLAVAEPTLIAQIINHTSNALISGHKGAFAQIYDQYLTGWNTNFSEAIKTTMQALLERGALPFSIKDHSTILKKIYKKTPDESYEDRIPIFLLFIEHFTDPHTRSNIFHKAIEMGKYSLALYYMKLYTRRHESIKDQNNKLFDTNNKGNTLLHTLAESPIDQCTSTEPFNVLIQYLLQDNLFPKFNVPNTQKQTPIEVAYIHNNYKFMSSWIIHKQEFPSETLLLLIINTQQMSKTNDELTERNSALDKENNTLKEKTQELDALKTTSTQQATTIKNLNVQVQEKDTLVRQQKDDIARLQQKQQQEQERTDQLSNTSRLQTTELNIKETLLTTANNTIERQDQQIIDLNARIQKNQNEIDQQQNQIKNLNKKITDLTKNNKVKKEYLQDLPSIASSPAGLIVSGSISLVGILAWYLCSNPDYQQNALIGTIICLFMANTLKFYYDYTKVDDIVSNLTNPIPTTL